METKTNLSNNPLQKDAASLAKAWQQHLSLSQVHSCPLNDASGRKQIHLKEADTHEEAKMNPLELDSIKPSRIGSAAVVLVGCS